MKSVYSARREQAERALVGCGKSLLLIAVSAVLAGTVAAQRSLPVHPPGIQFDATLSYSSEGELILSYALTNGGAKPLVVDPTRLFIYYGPSPVPYKLVRLPAPGRANRLSLGETEHGTLTISDPPFDSDNLQLVWTLVEIGPNIEHTLLIDFGDMISVGHTSDTYLGTCQGLLAAGVLYPGAPATPLRVFARTTMKRLGSSTFVLRRALHLRERQGCVSHSPREGLWEAL